MRKRVARRCAVVGVLAAMGVFVGCTPTVQDIQKMRQPSWVRDAAGDYDLLLRCLTDHEDAPDDPEQRRQTAPWRIEALRTLHAIDARLDFVSRRPDAHRRLVEAPRTAKRWSNCSRGIIRSARLGPIVPRTGRRGALFEENVADWSLRQAARRLRRRSAAAPTVGRHSESVSGVCITGVPPMAKAQRTTETPVLHAGETPMPQRRFHAPSWQASHRINEAPSLRRRVRSV
ncbi:MAG: hypothetical protein KGY99_03805 [Phycisphaerae bacterium]|nr:hypothetical protein [Phycisphaerae bacterium]